MGDRSRFECGPQIAMVLATFVTATIVSGCNDFVDPGLDSKAPVSPGGGQTVPTRDDTSGPPQAKSGSFEKPAGPEGRASRTR